MDDNTRDVLVAGITVLGTLLGTAVGVALGVWLEGQRRHDDQKRDAYARFVAVGREAEVSLHALADSEARHDPISSDWGSRLRDCFAIIEVIGSPDVILAARGYAASMSTMAIAWLADASAETQIQRVDTDTKAKEARRGFTDAARRDLGSKKLN